jgi:integrase
MARVKDLWFSEVPVRDADGKPLRDDTGHVVMMKKKTAKHPDNGGSKTAKRWLACWNDPDGVEVTQAFAKQSDAKEHGERMEADADRGEYIDPKAGEAKFGPLAEKYLRLRDVGGGSHERYWQVYRNQVKATFAHRSTGAVKPSDILEWLRSPEIASLGQSTQGLAFMIVAGTFDLAVADKIRRDNPARNRIVPTPPQGDAPPRELWTPQQLWAVIDAHPDRYRAIPQCGAGLGLRPSEALALAEEDFDLEGMRVHVQRQVVLVNRKWYFKAPKRGKDRWVPLPRGLAAIIRAHTGDYPPQPYELPWMGEKGNVARDPHVCRLLFRWESADPRTNARHIHPGNYDHAAWTPALRAAGLSTEAAEGRKSGNGAHILRHMYSQSLQEAGIAPAAVAEFLGHSKRQLPITFRVYGHVTDKTFDQARRAIDKAVFRLRPVASQNPGGTVAELRAAR